MARPPRRALDYAPYRPASCSAWRCGGATCAQKDTSRYQGWMCKSRVNLRGKPTRAAMCITYLLRLRADDAHLVGRCERPRRTGVWHGKASAFPTRAQTLLRRDAGLWQFPEGGADAVPVAKASWRAWREVFSDYACYTAPSPQT